MTDNRFVTPVGRLVSGDCHTAQDKDLMGQPLTVKTGPNTGALKVQFFLGIAIEKTNPDWAPLWTAMSQIARAGFPTLFTTDGSCTNPKFAWKVSDGDSQVPNDKGVRPCDRPGYAGCWILRASTGFAPSAVNQETVAIEPETIKRGYYIRLGITVQANGQALNPGLFVSHNFVQLCAYGPEISTGPDAAAVFAAPIGALPAGATTVPPAPTAALPAAASPAAPPAPPAAAGPPAAPPPPAAAPTGPPAPPPADTVQPAPDFLAGRPPPPPAEPTFVVADGSVWTRAQLVAGGYNETQIAALPPAA